MPTRSQAARLRRDKNRGKSKRRGTKSVNTGTSYINYSSGPDKDEMKLYKDRTGNSLYRDKGGKIHVNPTQTPEFIAYWESVYPSMKYSKREIKEMGMPDEYGIIRNNPVPRGEALRRIDELALQTDMTLHYRWKPGPPLTVDIFFNAQRTKFYALETDLDRRHIRRSEIYGYAEIIKNLWPKKLLWKSTIKIGPEE